MALSIQHLQKKITNLTRANGTLAGIIAKLTRKVGELQLALDNALEENKQLQKLKPLTPAPKRRAKRKPKVNVDT